MDKRTLIAVVLAVMVLMGYQFLFVKTPAEQPKPQQKQTETKTEQVKMETPLPEVAPVVAEEAAEAKDIKVETPFYTAILSSKGGTLKKFDLKDYKDEKGNPVSLIKPGGLYAPLAIGEKEDFALSKVNFTLKGADLTLTGHDTGTIVFEFASAGTSIRRSFTFYGDRYKIDAKDEVAGLPEYWIALGDSFGIFDAKDSTAPHVGPVVLKDTDRIELDSKKLSEPKTYKDAIRWIAQEDKYFFSSIIPSGQVIEAKAWKVQDSAEFALKMKPGINTFVVYAGPKEYDRLQELHSGLEHIIDFGFFSILARPLFWILKFFYKYIGNYGLAIILLTIIVRIPFIPLINKSQKSMKKMQEIQPKMAEIKEKFKKDPQRMQKETMELYKKYKVNPLGGCLPMLLQIPVFFALYKVLMIAIELRGAPFMMWIKDLSAPDTLFGHVAGFSLGGPLPYLMGVTMVIQQKMTPTSLDPKQNKIMMFMPVIFTFMFLNFASGLVLYWLVNNILSIIQQFYVNKKLASQSS